MRLINAFPSTVSQMFKNNIFQLDLEIFPDKLRYSIELPNNRYKLIGTFVLADKELAIDCPNIESNTTHTLQLTREVYKAGIGNNLNGLSFLILDVKREQETNDRFGSIYQYLATWHVNRTYLLQLDEPAHNIAVSEDILKEMYIEFSKQLYKGGV